MSRRRRAVGRSEQSKILSLRDRLKMQLRSERSIYSLGEGWAPVCPLCRKRLERPGDLHEALISRGKAEGPNQDRIYTRYNCVEVHHACHMGIVGVGGPITFERCARYLVEKEGRENVEEWLEDLSLVYEESANEALHRLKAVLDGCTDG